MGSLFFRRLFPAMLALLLTFADMAPAQKTTTGNSAFTDAIWNPPGLRTGGLTGAAVDFTSEGTVTTLMMIEWFDGIPNTAPEHNPTAASWTFDVDGVGYGASFILRHAITPFGGAAVSRYLGTGTDWDFTNDGATATTATRLNVTDLSSRWAVAISGAPMSMREWMLLAN